MDKQRSRPLKTTVAAALVFSAFGMSGEIRAASAQATSPAAASLTYADLAALVDNSEFVMRAEIRSQAEVPYERAPGVPRGKIRLYIEAKPLSLLGGQMPVADDGTYVYLVDVPLTAKGNAPKLKGLDVLLFGRQISRRPGEIQLAGPLAQQVASPAFEARVRPIADAFYAADAPPHITGVRDVLWVPGNLAGESETQIFLGTDTAEPALISVVRRPGMEPQWGVSWTELVDPNATPPAHNTIAWFRLACSLPARLPAAAQLSGDAESRARAQEDYRLVLSDLGPCTRSMN